MIVSGSAHSRVRHACLALASFGLVAGAGVCLLSATSNKLAILLPVAAGSGLLLLLAGNYWERILLFSTIFFTSLNLKVHFLTYNEHLGGANGLRVSAVFCLLIILFAKLLYDTGGRLRINWWITAPFLLYLAAAILSTSWAIHPALGLIQASQLLQAYLILLYLSNRIQRDADYYLAVCAIALGVALQGGIALAQSYLSLKLDYTMLGGAEEAMIDIVAGEDIKRYSGLFKHPANLGIFFVLYLPLTLGVVLTHKNLLLQLAVTFSACLGLGALTLTFSRAAMIGMVVTLALITLLLVWRRILHWRTTLWLILLEILLGLGVFLWKGQDIYLRFTQSESAPVDVRFELADIAKSMIFDYPWLGVGLNNFTLLVEDYERLTRYVAEFRHPVHNIFLLEFSETGVVGGVLFLLYLAGIFWTVWTTARHTSALQRYLAIAVPCSIFGFLLISISDWTYRLPEMNTVFFTDLGLLGALHFSSKTT